MTYPRLSIILASTFRPTLNRAINSALNQMSSIDELLLVSAYTSPISIADSRIKSVYCPPGHDWGNLERATAIPVATGTHLMFLDDDDQFLIGGLEAVRNSLIVYPDRPHMFRMVNENGLVLWQTKEISQGNHGTPNFVVPNDPSRLGTWHRGAYEADLTFCRETLDKYPDGDEALIWSEAIIYGCRGWVLGSVLSEPDSPLTARQWSSYTIG